MMKRIKVSACIITYNQEVYIRDCLDGAINQLLNYEYEIVIGDDCSTDNTFQICQEYANKYPDTIRLLSREKNMGMAVNWINTIQSCQGKYIALCEGDDYWTDNKKLQIQVDLLEANTNYVLSFHKVAVQKVTGEIVEDFLTNVPENYQDIIALAERGNYIHTPSVVFRNSINKFPFEFEQSPMVDYFLYLLLVENGNIHYSEDKMCVYRYGVGVYSSATLFKKITNNLKLFTLLISYSNRDDIKKIFLERQARSIDALMIFLKGEQKILFLTKNKWATLIKKFKNNYNKPYKIINKAIKK